MIRGIWKMASRTLLGAVVGGALVASGVWLMERILHVHTPSPEELGEIIREKVADDLVAYLDAVDGLSELREDDDE